MKQAYTLTRRFPRLATGIRGNRPPISDKATPGVGAAQQGGPSSANMRTLAGGLAHRLNNALTVINCNTEMIRQALPPDSPLLDMLKRIEATAHCTEDMTRQLLQYAQVSKQVLEKIKVSRLMEDLDEGWRSGVSGKITVEYHLSPDLPEMLGDWVQLRRFVKNLFRNACEAMGDKEGAIVVRAQTVQVNRDFLAAEGVEQQLPQGRYIWLQVVDSGCGMDEETSRHVFEPFYSTKFIGRGLGLCAGLGIVRQHMGTMWVNSAPGDGTTVHVLLPFGEAA